MNTAKPSCDPNVIHRGLRQKTEILAATNKSFSKHVRQLYSFQRAEEKLHEKLFQEATESGGQVLDDFIEHRIKVEQTDNRKTHAISKDKILKSRVKLATENVDLHIAGMKRQDRRKVVAAWDHSMEQAYQDFLSNHAISNALSEARMQISDIEDCSRLQQSMANFLRFGKITIKLPVTQTHRYRQRLIGGAGGDRHIIREIINHPLRKMTVTPIKAHKEKSSLWKKIAAKVQKIGNARKLTDSKYGHRHETGMTEGEACVAEKRLSEAILSAHNWGVDGYIIARAKYLQHRSSERTKKNTRRLLNILQKQQLVEKRIVVQLEVTSTRERLGQLEAQWLNEEQTLKEFQYDKSVRHFITGKWNSMKDDGGNRHGVISHQWVQNSVLPRNDGEESNLTGVESRKYSLNLKRLKFNSSKYAVRVRSRGGGGFGGEQNRRMASKERQSWAATVLQKVVRGYICRIYVWGKRWLLQRSNQAEIFNVYSGNSDIMDLRPFAMLAGMFGRNLPAQRTIANHRFIIRYMLHKNRGLTLGNFHLWVDDHAITQACSGFEKIRVAQMAKVQYRMAQSAQAAASSY